MDCPSPQQGPAAPGLGRLWRSGPGRLARTAGCCSSHFLLAGRLGCLGNKGWIVPPSGLYTGPGPERLLSTATASTGLIGESRASSQLGFPWSKTALQKLQPLQKSKIVVGLPSLSSVYPCTTFCSHLCQGQLTGTLYILQSSLSPSTLLNQKQEPLLHSQRSLA